MSLNIINRLIVSPGKQHRQITNFLTNELHIHPTDLLKRKEHLRIDFLTQGRSASIELRTLVSVFPTHNFDLIWYEEPLTYVKAMKVLENNFYQTAYLGWGLSDYLDEDNNQEHEITLMDYDWTALEYDLLLASYHGGFLENSKIIPDLLNFESLEVLLSRRFTPDSLSAQALVIHSLSEGIPIENIPTDYLSSDLYKVGFQRQLIPFESLPNSMLSEEFIEEACFYQGKTVFVKIDPKNLSEDICLAAITAVKDPISLRDIPAALRTQFICEFALHQEIDQFRFVPKKILSQEFCNQFPAAIQFIPNDFKTLELCKQALRISESNLAFVPKHFITQTLINKIIRESNEPKAFVEFVPTELFTSRLVKALIKKNPREFKFIPEEFKSYEITKRYVLREIENLVFAPHEMLEELLNHRTIKSLLWKHENSLSLLPKSYLTKEFVLEIFKGKGIQLEEIPNHLISEPLILLAVRRIKKLTVETDLYQTQYQSIATNCSKPKVWQLFPNKLKDYEFCKIAIIHAHPSVEADILVHIIEHTPREIDSFNDSVEWLYYFIENKLSPAFRDQHLIQIDLSDYLDRLIDGRSPEEEELNAFVGDLVQDIIHTPKQFQTFQEIGSAAWRLWVELCSTMYPSLEDAEHKSPSSAQAARFLHSSKQVKILNLYLKIIDQENNEKELEDENALNT